MLAYDAFKLEPINALCIREKSFWDLTKKFLNCLQQKKRHIEKFLFVFGNSVSWEKWLYLSMEELILKMNY